MAKGLQKHQEHKNKLSLLGKDLARRSNKKCELCGSAGVSLTAVEMTLNPEPSIENCVFICDQCNTQVFNIKQRDENYLRCLNGSVWSETLIVQATAISILKQLQTDWTSDLLDKIYLFTELEAMISEVEKTFAGN